jgi:hypothetical protein
MLTEQQLLERFDAQKIPSVGIDRIRRIRDEFPSAVIRTTKKAGKTRYASLKMPFVTEGAADSTEWAAMIHWDHDDETDEFYPQPISLSITHKVGITNRKTTHFTRADYLRITKSAFTFVECKTEEELITLAKESPDRFQRQADGSWRSPPGEIAAAEFGCKFEIRSSAQNNWILMENYEILKDYFIGKPKEPNKENREHVIAVLNEHAWSSTFDLIHLDPAISADDLYLMLVRREVFFPIQEMRLTNQEHALLFRSEETYLAFQTMLGRRIPGKFNQDLGVELKGGETFNWSGNKWCVINPSKTLITIQRLDSVDAGGLAEFTPENFWKLVRAKRIVVEASESIPSLQGAHELLRKAKPSAILEANQRYQVLFGVIASTKNPLSNRGKRSRAYWLRQFRDAEGQYGSGFVGLLTRRSGNRKSKAPKESIDLAKKIIEEDWETIRRKARITSYGKYSTLARGGGKLNDGTELKGGIPAVSYVTFCGLVKQRSGYEQKAKRDGEKAAQDLEPEYLQLDETTPKHGVRMWHIGHIDHTPLPLKFVDNILGQLVKTVWLTLLFDAFTRKVLAIYLSFDEPSYRSCMMVMRECVRKYGRVPQTIVCDQGSDFNSTYWETLLAMLRITKKERRSGKPREGNVIERVFKTTAEQFIHHLMGATEIVERYFRSVSPEVDPTRNAIWVLDRMETALPKYFDEVYHVNHQSGIGMAPNTAELVSLKAHGKREHRIIPYTEEFIAQTCPPVHRGTARVTPQGIKSMYRWFNCDAFRMPGVLGTDVPARYDPFNSGIVRAFVLGHWQLCFSEMYAVFSKYSERAIRLASERLRLQDRRSGRAVIMNAERLAMFLTTVEGDEATAEQLRHDKEAAGYRERINDTGNSVDGAPTGFNAHEGGQAAILLL